MKSSSLILIVVLFVVAVAGIIFLRPGGVASLFSQSINTGEPDSGVPAIQSLDNQISGEVTVNREQEIKNLKQELLETVNDPDKALEIRRRLQILQAEVQK